MALVKAAETRTSFQEVADRANTSHQRVRNLVGAGILGPSGYQPGTPGGPLSAEAGELIARVLRAHVASPSTAEIMKTDPAMVLEAALALAELARWQMQGGIGEQKAAA
jgi:hypothetical protein